jgi:hypothetical protein
MSNTCKKKSRKLKKKIITLRFINEFEKKIKRTVENNDNGNTIRVIINDCLIAVGVGNLVECAASFIK